MKQTNQSNQLDRATLMVEDDGVDEEALEDEAPSVLHTELEEATALDSRGLPLMSDVLTNLRKPILMRHIQWLEGKTNRQSGRKGPPIPYIAWPTACGYLDHYAPPWSYEILRVAENTAGTLLVVQARITIPHRGGISIRDALGGAPLANSGFGDPYSNAEAKALKRAAAKFGLARHLYTNEGRPRPPAEVLRQFS